MEVIPNSMNHMTSNNGQNALVAVDALVGRVYESLIANIQLSNKQ